MGLLLLSLLGCDPYSGTWLLFYEVIESPEKSDIGRDQTISAEVYQLSDGGYGVDFGSLLMFGTIEGGELSADYESGYTYSDDNCDESSSTTTYSITGDISASAGFDGEMKYVTVQETKACGGSDSDSTTTVGSVTGVKLNANDDLHADGTVSWGY